LNGYRPHYSGTSNKKEAGESCVNAGCLRVCARYKPRLQHGCFSYASYLRRMAMCINEPVTGFWNYTIKRL